MIYLFFLVFAIALQYVLVLSIFHDGTFYKTKRQFVLDLIPFFPLVRTMGSWFRKAKKVWKGLA